jgi:hypothetical protein
MEQACGRHHSQVYTATPRAAMGSAIAAAAAASRATSSRKTVRKLRVRGC